MAHGSKHCSNDADLWWSPSPLQTSWPEPYGPYSRLGRFTVPQQANAELDHEKSKNIGALRGLRPFLEPYRLLVVLALCALTLTASMSFMLPVAVRRVVDNLGTESDALLAKYFLAALGCVAFLAVGTALRYMLMTRFGELVVTGIRKSVFARVISMIAAFFENLMTGEVLGRITTDTRSVIGSSSSIVLSNVMLFIGGYCYRSANPWVVDWRTRCNIGLPQSTNGYRRGRIYHLTRPAGRCYTPRIRHAF